MEKTLLIMILIATFLVLLSSIYTAIVVSKETKNKDLVKKTSIAMAIVAGAVLLIALVMCVSNIEDKNAGNIAGTGTTENTESAVESAGFNEVTIDEYLNLVKGSEKSIILIARPTCGYCEKFAPVLKEIKEEMNLTINYIDTDKFSEEDFTKLESSVSYFKENSEWGTPTLLIVQNGDSIADHSGYAEADAVKEFFNNNGFGK